MKIAIILIRGLAKVNTDIKDTLFMLGLRKKHTCVIKEDTPSTMGMIKKAKDYITWGTVDDETLSLLEKKMGDKRFCSLHPPRGGFERKGIKKSVAQGGALGDRKEKISELIRKMI